MKTSPWQRLRKIFVQVSTIDILYLTFLTVIFLFFLGTTQEDSFLIHLSYVDGIILFLTTLIGLCLIWCLLVLGLDEHKASSRSWALVTLSPIFLLAFLIPYNIFPFQIPSHVPLETSLVLVILCQWIFYRILKNSEQAFSKNIFQEKLRFALGIIVLLYAIILGSISLLRYYNYQDVSSFDTGLYNQILWNSLRGNFFQTSTFGSAYVAHNSSFLIFLIPFYAVYPSPATLIILKTAFLSLCAFPSYLIIKENLTKNAILPLVCGFMLYPFFIGQHFNAPREICFLPLLLLFSIYYFLKNKFLYFMAFLFLSVSIKEHIALVAIAFGIYAFFVKRGKKWILGPILLGGVWAVSSLWILNRFKELYQSHPFPDWLPMTWLMDNLKNRFLFSAPDLWQSLYYGLSTSNLAYSVSLIPVYMLFSPFLLILPFLDSFFLLCLPELVINLLTDKPLFFPIWHYNLVVSCFMLTGVVMAIKKVSQKTYVQIGGLTEKTIQQLFSWFVFFCILTHHFLWSDFLIIKNNRVYVKTMSEAIALIPKEATVTVPRNIAAYVSSRPDYFLFGDGRKGQYLILDDSDKSAQELFFQNNWQEDYKEIFSKNSVRVFRKSGGL